MKRINEILAIDDAKNNADKNIGDKIQEISVKNVFFRYSTFEPDVLKGVCITIESNQKIAIVGLNGAAKSTLLKCIGGLLWPIQNIFSTLMAGAYDYLEIAKSSEEYRKKIEDVARWNWYLGKYGLKEK